MTALRARKLAGLGASLLVTTTSMSSADVEHSASEIRLFWSRGPEASSCAEASEVEADVTRRLGFDPFSANAKSAIECHVTRKEGVWAASIEELDETGARAGFRVVTSPAESCASLGAAVGLAIALIVRNRAGSPPPSPPPAAAPPPPPPPPCAPCGSQPVPPRDDEASLGWFAAAVGAVRVLPEPSLGASLGGRLSVARSVSVAASVSFLPPVKTSDALGSYSFSAEWGALGACYDVEFGVDRRVSVCGSAALGALEVAVFDPTPVKPGARLFAGAIAGPHFAWKFARPAEFVAGIDAFLPFVRSEFLVAEGGTTKTVFEQPAVGALFTLGLGFAR